jgi:membrane protein insertase Oxa1/YidC/SpoIIIJ
MVSKSKVTGWVGWVVFAGFIMVLVGIFQGIYGLLAIFNSTWFISTDQGLLFLDLSTWGWVHFILGLIVLLAGFAVLSGQTWGRAIGVILAALSALAALFSINIHPVWSIAVMVVDVLVIYALTVHGSEAKNL